MFYTMLTIAATAVVANGPSATAPSSVPTVIEAPAAESLGHPADVVIDDSMRIDFTSKINGRPYSLLVSLPDQPPPPKGYPVVYVLDGNAHFATFAAGDRGPVGVPKVIVGLGYQKGNQRWIAEQIAKRSDAATVKLPSGNFEAAAGVARFYDLTPNLGPEQSVRQSGLTPEDVGGADIFLEVIEKEVKPKIEALTRVNRDRQALFGHSLGGLFVLNALLSRPETFSTFIASSPSIYWADKGVLRYEAGFRAKVEAGKVAPRILIAVGGLEETVPKKLPPMLDQHREAFEADVRSKQMISTNCALVDRLKALHGGPRYEVAECSVPPNIWHVLAALPAIGRTLTFLNDE